MKKSKKFRTFAGILAWIIALGTIPPVVSGAEEIENEIGIYEEAEYNWDEPVEPESEVTEPEETEAEVIEPEETEPEVIEPEEEPQPEEIPEIPLYEQLLLCETLTELYELLTAEENAETLALLTEEEITELLVKTDDLYNTVFIFDPMNAELALSAEIVGKLGALPNAPVVVPEEEITAEGAPVEEELPVEEEILTEEPAEPETPAEEIPEESEEIPVEEPAETPEQTLEVYGLVKVSGRIPEGVELTAEMLDEAEPAEEPVWDIVDDESIEDIVIDEEILYDDEIIFFDDMIVEAPVYWSSGEEAEETAEETETEYAFAIDITLYDEFGEVWQPDEPVTVTLDAYALGLNDGDEIQILHEHDGWENDLGVYTVEEGELMFEVDGFSVMRGILMETAELTTVEQEAETYLTAGGPVAVSKTGDLTTVENGQGITFKLFDYDHNINTNQGLINHFGFRGTSYDASEANKGNTSVPNYGESSENAEYDKDGYNTNYTSENSEGDPTHATVEKKLGKDGYPVFSFRGETVPTGVNPSLGYLFGAGGNGVTSYTPTNTLLVKDGNWYEYSSLTNACDYNASDGTFYVRNYLERTTTTAGYKDYYDFLPFNNTSDTVSEGGCMQYDSAEVVNYWFGMTMEVDFYMPKNGKVDGEDMVFEFSGDDDVWVFIDDVLILDLGGTHGSVNGTINFATGEIKQWLSWSATGLGSAYTYDGAPESNKYPITNIAKRFEEAGESLGEGKTTFVDYTEHTLKFYYLERATSVANCGIKFNMPTLPSNTLIVEKTVDGNMGDRNREFDFRIQMDEVRSLDTSVGALTSISYTKKSANDTVLETNTIDVRDEKVEFDFKLRHGEKIEFPNLAVGTKYKVIEQSEHPYVTTINGEVKEENEISGTVSDSGGIRVEFTNTYNATIDTAVTLDILPYIILFSIVGTGVILASADHRRKADEVDD